MRIYLRACVVVAVLTGLGFLLPAVAGQPIPAPPTPPHAPAKPVLKVKVFKLERTEPDNVIQSMRMLLEDPDVEVPQPPVPQATVPVLVVPGFGIQFMNPGFGFGGFGMLGGGPPVEPPLIVPQWRVARDDRTGAVIVRGSEKHQKVAADLVAIFDRKPNSPIPKLQIVKAFPLKHAQSGDIESTITTLGLDDVKMSSLDDTMLLVIGPDETTQTIGELVKELDVPARSRPKE
ncbi:MAG: hypothetical protein U0792_22060 [Gemmataceae bacterium]